MKRLQAVLPDAVADRVRAAAEGLRKHPRHAHRLWKAPDITREAIAMWLEWAEGEVGEWSSDT